jgi:hypothetical protein
LLGEPGGVDADGVTADECDADLFGVAGELVDGYAGLVA